MCWETSLRGTRVALDDQLIDFRFWDITRSKILQTAVCCCEVLNHLGLLSIPPRAIAQGAAAVHMPARFEVLFHRPIVVVDGAPQSGWCQCARVLFAPIPEKEAVGRFDGHVRR